MMRAAGFVIGLIVVACGAPASAQDSPEGIYVTEIREVASGLILQPDGRFRWMFTTGALDMSAEGRWRREGNDVLLDTEPPVTAPRFEFLGAGREAGAGLVVRIEDERGRVPQYLDVEARYDAGEPGYAPLDEEVYRFTPAPGRRIVAIRVGSAPFNFWSEPYPVPADANRMRFRFFPGDLGRTDFRGTRAVIEGNTLTLPLMGSSVGYRRVTAAEAAAMESGVEPPAPPPTPESVALEDRPPLTDPVEISIRGTIDPALDRVTEEHGNGLIVGVGPIDLRFRQGEDVLDFGRIGGERYLLFGLRAPRPGRAVTVLSFAPQDRLLTLDEVVERAQSIEARLRAADFVPRPADPARSEPEAFVATVHARTDIRGSIASDVRAADWASAAPLLADEAVGVSTMHLLNVRAGEVLASAYLQNLRRRPPEIGDAPAGFAGGREWRLEVVIELDPEIAERESPSTPDE